jgi:hypothetical protein
MTDKTREEATTHLLGFDLGGFGSDENSDRFNIGIKIDGLGWKG